MEWLPRDAAGGLLVDLYHLDSAYVSWATDHNPTVTFDLYTRKLPFGGAYLLVAGLELALEMVNKWGFSADDIAYLRATQAYAPEFLEQLASSRFSGDIWAIPEGEIAFDHEPLLRVTGPFQEALILESALIHLISVSTLIATKASRVVRAAQGKSVAEFGFRRSQAPYIAARSAMIGGCASTSFVDAAKTYDLPTSGTIPHALVELYPEERDAFAAVASALDRYSLLLDTYDVEQATETAIQVALEQRKRLGHELASVRLDSGDLAADAIAVRAQLDKAGLDDVLILASGDLDEWKIRDLLASDPPIDGFGVGTAVATGNGSVAHGVEGTALGGVYKLAWVEGGAPPVKIAGDKSTWPGVKQVVRVGEFQRDVIQLESEQVPEHGRSLLTQVMCDGSLLEGAIEPIDVLRGRARRELERLPDRHQQLEDPADYPVDFSDQLRALRHLAMERHGR